MSIELATTPDDGSASKRVFMKLYRIRAPLALTMSKAEIELYGQRVSGIKDLDRWAANQMTTGRCTTVAMSRIIERGGYLMFCNKFDVKQCYIDLHQHLVNWEYLLGTRYNINSPPKEDIEVLKELLDALESYSGILDREDYAKNPIGNFSVLSNSNFQRKGFSERVRIDPNFERNQIPLVNIEDWDDIAKLNRSM